MAADSLCGESGAQQVAVRGLRMFALAPQRFPSHRSGDKDRFNAEMFRTTHTTLATVI